MLGLFRWYEPSNADTCQYWNSQCQCLVLLRSSRCPSGPSFETRRVSTLITRVHNEYSTISTGMEVKSCGDFFLSINVLCCLE